MQPQNYKAPYHLQMVNMQLLDWDGVCGLASLTLFPSNIRLAFMSKESIFWFRGPFSKKLDLFTCVQLQTVVWLFL